MKTDFLVFIYECEQMKENKFSLLLVGTIFTMDVIANNQRNIYVFE